MPRQTESQEAKILRWFRAAPYAAATLLLGLVKDAMKERAEDPDLPPRYGLRAGGPKPPKPAAKPKSHHKREAASGGAHNWTSPHERPGRETGAGGGKAEKGHKPTGKKRSHHKRPRPTNGAEGAEVEEFGAGGE
jgi:hypothetical protein